LRPKAGKIGQAPNFYIFSNFESSVLQESQTKPAMTFATHIAAILNVVLLKLFEICVIFPANLSQICQSPDTITENFFRVFNLQAT
jgi:hypothetical protein